MCELTTRNVRNALERTKRHKISEKGVYTRGNKSVELQWQINGKIYRKSISMDEIKSAYGKALKSAGLM